MSEIEIMRLVQLDCSMKNWRVFRTQSGLFFTADGRPVKIGHPGISDLTGWSPLLVTQEHVGKTIPVYTAIEVKTPATKNRVTEDQNSFLQAVANAGGLAMVQWGLRDFKTLTPI